MKNRTQEQLDYDAESFQREVIELRKDFHDRCADHECQECAP